MLARDAGRLTPRKIFLHTGNMQSPESSQNNGFVIGSGMRGHEHRTLKSFGENFVEAIMDTIVIFGIYAVIIMGRSITDRKIMSIMMKPDVYIWFVMLVGIGAFMKSFYPRCEENVLNAAMFNCVRVMMYPIHPGPM